MSLPTIEMPEPVPEPEVFPDKTDKIIDTLETKEEIKDLVIEDVSSDEEPAPALDKEEDVFKTPVIKPIVEEDEDIPEIPEKKVRKKYERTKPMSIKQKEHLERIRKIAADKKKVIREQIAHH